MISVTPKVHSSLSRAVDVSLHDPDSATAQTCAKVAPSDPDLVVLRLGAKSGDFVLPIYLVPSARSLAFLRQLRTVVSDLIRWMEGRLCYGCEEKPPAGDLSAPALCGTCLARARAEAAAQVGQGAA